MNTKLRAVSDADGRPIRFFITAGQVSDYNGAAALLGSLTKAAWQLAECGYDSDWFREALKAKGIKPCTPGRNPRGQPIIYNKRRNRLLTHVNMRCQVTDPNHVRAAEGLATGCNPRRQAPEGFHSVIALAAIVMFWL